MTAYHYEARNANGNTVKCFGADYVAAKRWIAASEACGLRYGLRIAKYRVAA